MRERFDGTPAPDVPPYRQMVPYLMRRRNEAAVYFEQVVDLGRTLPWIERFNAEHDVRVTVFHLVLGAIPRVLAERPRLNRFVAGRRIYQRKGVWVSFAAKKRLSDDAPLAVVKEPLDAAEPFADLVARLAGGIDEARSDRTSSVDRELALLLRLPRPVLDAAVRLLWWLDGWNLAPAALLRHDPMYCSVFVANLGSIKIDAAYHHLYEHGNCPVFLTIGRVERAVVAGEDGAARVRPVVRLKYSFDERVEDGLYCARALEGIRTRVEDPASWAG